MGILVIFGGPILVGFVLGYFLTVGALCAITAVAVMICGYMWLRAREIEVMIAMMYSTVAGIALASMWVTYYLSTSQTIVGDLLKGYVLR